MGFRKRRLCQTYEKKQYSQRAEKAYLIYLLDFMVYFIANLVLFSNTKANNNEEASNNFVFIRPH
ncbi:conserved hypothetical protein [delta proteobacterium NaphS2]|nr:conserved hypothetical protein [delta proteobacterium NaphS2]